MRMPSSNDCPYSLDYANSSLIIETETMTLSKVVDASSNADVLVKTFKNHSQEHLVSLQREWEITKDLPSRFVVKPSYFSESENQAFSIYEDPDCLPLSLQMKSIKFDTEQFLDISLSIVGALSAVHIAKIIHGSLTPYNIFRDKKDNSIKLFDFTQSRLWSEPADYCSSISKSEGIHYIPPERFATVPTAADYRSDFYSVGAILYEMLMGFCPFQGKTRSEYITNHLTKEPISPHKLNSSIPEAISNIVLKLLEKSEEDRYQSAIGLRHDLTKCKNWLTKNKPVTAFDLGEVDTFKQLLIPYKLYGRDAQRDIITSAFYSVTKESKKSIFVSGYSGIGKTSLVNSVANTVASQKGYFISGKSDPLYQSIPYRPFIQAFGGFLQKLLTLDENELALRKEHFQKALGPNGQIITNILPELGFIIGVQPDVEEVDHFENQNRFNIVFMNFIRACTLGSTPLVLYLDDLHWADNASIGLLKMMASDEELGNILTIGAYRDNEVSDTHPLRVALEECTNNGVEFESIDLTGLSQELTNSFINDMLGYEEGTETPLGELCHQKTGGNPFFLKQFLIDLYRDDLISYDNPEEKWSYDILKIKQKGLTDNVIELMVRKIGELPVTTQNTLKYASCFGSQFAPASIVVLGDRRRNEVSADIWEALREGLIVPSYNSDDPLESQTTSYDFVHDRIRQAAYQLLEDEERIQNHIAIGLFLQNNYKTSLKQTNIFDIATHANFGIDRIKNNDDRLRVIEINLAAGKEAMVSVAYDQASRYFKIGIEILDSGSWTGSYELTLELYSLAAEASYLCGDFQQMEDYCQEVHKHAKEILDEVGVFETKIFAYQAQSLAQKAIATSLTALKRLGVSFPRGNGYVTLLLELLKIKFLLRGRGMEKLATLPPMKDPLTIASIKILTSVGPILYLAAPVLFLLGTLKTIGLSLKKGRCIECLSAYGSYSMVLNGVLGEFDKSYELTQIVLELADNYKRRKFTSKILFITNSFLRHWKVGIKDTLAPLEKGYQYAIETGDYEYAVYNSHMHHVNAFVSGIPLPLAKEKFLKNSMRIKKVKHTVALNWSQMYLQVVENLSNVSPNPWILDGEYFDERVTEQLYRKENDLSSMLDLYLFKALLAYYCGNTKIAYQYSRETKKFLSAGLCSVFGPLHFFFDSLVKVAMAEKANFFKKRYLLLSVARNQKKMKKWASHAPMNYLHKWYLVEAEVARLNKRTKKAVSHYRKAFQLAGENGFIQEQGLAYELVAKFYSQIGDETAVETYIEKSHKCYEKWGATAISQKLMTNYPQMFQELPRRKEKNATNSNDPGEALNAGGTSGNELVAGGLDEQNLVDDAMQICKEQSYDEMVLFLVDVLGKKAFAQRTVALRAKDNEWTVVGTNETQVPVQYPSSVVNYVSHTQRSIVVENACKHDTYASDEYFAKMKNCCIMCCPILEDNKTVAVVYFENNLAAEEFDEKNIPSILKLANVATKLIEENQQYKTHDILSVSDKYLEHKMDASEMESYKRRLEEYMSTQEPYLQPDLTMKELADELALTPRELSQLINSVYQRNFYTFVNRYRIERVKRLLKDPKYKQESILSISWESGFRSKSSFNTFFKNQVGVTPTQYRKQ